MSSLSYEASKSIALKTILILAAVTVLEVLIALVGKGYIGGMDFTHTFIGAAIIGLAMIALSAYKAITIIFEFMHMKYEIKGLAMSVLLPTLLLVWAIIAFLYEGNWWLDLRDRIQQKNRSEINFENKNNLFSFDADACFKEDTYIL